MKRKVIQVANTTLLVSLPLKWAKEYKVRKGDEIELEIQGKNILIKSDKTIELEEKEISIKRYGNMIARTIIALYQKGVDVIRITVDTPKQIEIIQQAISNETVGYEIIEQGKSQVTIRSITPNIEEFDNMLKRIFLLQMNLAHDMLEAVEKKDQEKLQNIRALEKTNNRLTTMCRRSINKRGDGKRYTGPMYNIVERFENLADEYKYMADFLQANQKVPINRDVVALFRETLAMTEMLNELYHNFDDKIVADMGKKRKELIARINSLLEKPGSKADIRLLHHLSVITQDIFCFVNPIMVIKL